ncbi:MAG: DUF3126 family protein [Alphaproteobacteria bacterium]|nr:DUF3126 family protein [Alphaproteobacteria bacterium]
MDKTELAKIEAYLRKTFGLKNIGLRAQPKKADMAEVFIGDEFIATLYRIEDEGEIEYQLQMAILEMDLEDV